MLESRDVEAKGGNERWSGRAQEEKKWSKAKQNHHRNEFEIKKDQWKIDWKDRNKNTEYEDMEIGRDKIDWKENNK